MAKAEQYRRSVDTLPPWCSSVVSVEHFEPYSQQTSEYHLRIPGYLTLLMSLCLSFQIEICTLWGLYFCLIFWIFFFLPSTCIPDTKPGSFLQRRNKPKRFSGSLCWLLLALPRHKAEISYASRLRRQSLGSGDLLYKPQQCLGSVAQPVQALCFSPTATMVFSHWLLRPPPFPSASLCDFILTSKNVSS